MLLMSAAAKALTRFLTKILADRTHLLDSAGSGTNGDLDRKVGHLDVLDRHGVSVEAAVVDEESEHGTIVSKRYIYSLLPVKINDVGDGARLLEGWDVDDAADRDEFREDHFDFKF